ncbi:hypothetical protein VC77_15465 [Vibrio cholerae]|nr:hypothetical protein VC77_15465 [Vibrio cholerae]
MAITSQQKSTASIRSVVTHFGCAYLLMRSAKQGPMSGIKNPAAAGFFIIDFSLRNNFEIESLLITPVVL